MPEVWVQDLPTVSQRVKWPMCPLRALHDSVGCLLMAYCLTTGYRDRPFAYFWDGVGACEQNLTWGNHPSIVMHDWVFDCMALMHYEVWGVDA